DRATGRDITNCRTARHVQSGHKSAKGQQAQSKATDGDQSDGDAARADTAHGHGATGEDDSVSGLPIRDPTPGRCWRVPADVHQGQAQQLEPAAIFIGTQLWAEISQPGSARSRLLLAN